jgi:hypothetical protein
LYFVAGDGDQDKKARRYKSQWGNMGVMFFSGRVLLVDKKLLVDEGLVMDGWNYFNYFTEIEEYFWKKRGAHLLVSPLDWAIMETWQKAGIPLEAALKGIDRAFESYQRSRRGGAGKPLKSLAYCTDAVLEAAEELQEAAAGSGAKSARVAAKEIFSREELKSYFARNLARVSAAAEKYSGTQGELSARFSEVARSLEGSMVLLESPGALDLEDLERRLTILDEKLQAVLASHANEERLLQIRREMDGQLAAYRGKMKAEQLAMVEKQYLQKRLLEEFGLPRLSLYYLA